MKANVHVAAVSQIFVAAPAIYVYANVSRGATVSTLCLRPREGTLAWTTRVGAKDCEVKKSLNDALLNTTNSRLSDHLDENELIAEEFQVAGVN